MTASDPRAVIEGIRAEMLSSGSDFWRRQMEQTAQHVSEDQYDGPMQFVRELIQNADDSDYPAGVVPEVTIRRTAREFVFESNECGFAAADVRALCGFGGSEKGKDKARFIGEKGLGFKSVFQVADRPEIHSNGFHFRFDKKAHKGLGRAIPEWIEGCEDAPGTRIVLPIRQDAAIPERDPDDLRAGQWILLFLRKINTLRYIDEVRSRVVELDRRFEGEMATLSHRVAVHGTMRESSERVFLLNRAKVEVSRISEAKRAGFAASTVEVAVPINRDRKVRLEDAGVAYAFLPVIETGLRYSFNADLLLVTDRSAPLENPWNIALCGGLGRCLADVITSFCGHDALGVVALGMLKQPVAGMKPLFRHVSDSAVAALRERACIPTATGKWVLPSQAVLPDSHGLQALLDPAHFAERTGWQLAATQVGSVVAEAELLGVRRLGFSEFEKCLQDSDWLKRKSAEWFRRLYCTLGRMRLSPAQLDALKRYSILRMGDGTTRSVVGADVFRGTGSSFQYGFERSIPILDSDSCNTDCDAFLDTIGVRPLAPKTIIDDYILRQHGAPIAMRSQDDEIVSHACYIIDHLEDYRLAAEGNGNPIGGVIAKLRILTRSESPQRRVARKASNLYLGAPYGDKHDLEGLWAREMPERFISPKYGQAAAPPGRVRNWSGFFKELRARDTPGIDLSASGAPVSWCRWREESKQLFSGASDERRWRFLAIVGSNWDEYQRAIDWVRIGTFDTELVQDLQSLEVVTTKGPTPLSECFLDTEDNRAVFGDDKPYLLKGVAERIFASGDFAEVCGVTVRPTMAGVLDRLRALSRTGADDSETAEQVRRLYQYLADRRGSWPQMLVTAFQTERIILAGHPSDGWISLKQACWDTGDGLGSHCPLRELKPRWPQFRDFFVGFLKVPENLTPEAWVQVLESVASSNEPKERAERLVRSAYLRLAAVLSTSDGSGLGAAAVRRMRAAALILCKDGFWRGLKTSHATVVFADDPQLEVALADQAGVAFIALPEGDRDDAQALLGALEIPRLREVARVHVPDGRAEAAAPSVAVRLRERMTALARVLYHNHRSEFRRAVSDGLFAFLAAADVWRTPAFRVVVGSSSVDCPLDAKLVGVGSSLRLFIGAQDAGGEVWKAIGVALGDELGLPPGVGDNLGGVLEAADSRALEQALRRLRVPELPPEVLRRLPQAGQAEAGSGAGSIQSEEGVSSIPSTPPPDASDPRTPIAGVASGAARSHRVEFAELETTAREALEQAMTEETDVKAIDQSDEESRPVELHGGGDEEDTEAAASPPRRVSRSPSDLGGDVGEQPRILRSGRSIIPRERQSFAARARLGPVPADDALIAEVEAAAVAFVMAEERRAGREPVDRNTPENPDNAGFDIESRDPRTQTIRFIEVKGTSHEWGKFGVAVTATQVRFALDHGDAAWLYVVECALDEKRRQCYRIQDFASKMWDYIDVEKFVVDGRLRSLAE